MFKTVNSPTWWETNIGGAVTKQVVWGKNLVEAACKLLPFTSTAALFRMLMYNSSSCRHIPCSALCLVQDRFSTKCLNIFISTHYHCNIMSRNAALWKWQCLCNPHQLRSPDQRVLLPSEALPSPQISCSDSQHHRDKWHLSGYTQFKFFPFLSLSQASSSIKDSCLF